MNVLFLSNEHRAEPQTAYTHRLSKLMAALAEQGVETEFVSLREHGIGRPILAQPFAFPFIRRRLAAADFIHAGGNAGYTAGLLRAYSRARIVQDIHGDSVSEAKLKWSERRDAVRGYWVAQAVIADAVTYRFGDFFTVVSERLRTKLIDERGISPQRIGVVRNGVDLELFRPRPASAHVGFVVGYAGGFQDWQGIENLVQAGELLEDRSIRLTIIGFGQRDADARATLAGRLGDRVELVDRVSQADLVTHLARVDALIIPRPRHAAVEAAFPTKFSEYLAIGKPLIVCDVDETASLVRLHGCGLVAQPNPRSIADTVTLASRLPAEELERMGRNARRLAERDFSWTEIGRGYASLLAGWAPVASEAMAQAR
jgi:glycosyltransferase involved in cell wall biosynthesis